MISHHVLEDQHLGQINERCPGCDRLFTAGQVVMVVETTKFVNSGLLAIHRRCMAAAVDEAPVEADVASIGRLLAHVERTGHSTVVDIMAGTYEATMA